MVADVVSAGIRELLFAMRDQAMTADVFAKPRDAAKQCVVLVKGARNRLRTQVVRDAFQWQEEEESVDTHLTSPLAYFSAYSCIAHSQWHEFFFVSAALNFSVHDLSDRKVIGHRCATVPLQHTLVPPSQCATGHSHLRLISSHLSLFHFLLLRHDPHEKH